MAGQLHDPATAHAPGSEASRQRHHGALPSPGAVDHAVRRATEPGFPGLVPGSFPRDDTCCQKSD